MNTTGLLRGLAQLLIRFDRHARANGDRLPWAAQGYRSLFEQHPDAVYAFDLDGIFVSANPACTRLSGYDVCELVGQHWCRVVAPEDVDHVQLAFTQAARGVAQTYTTTIVH